MEAIGIGDLHLTDFSGKGGLAKYIEDHDGMVIQEMNKVMKYATNNGITNIFLYGDICNSPRMSYSAMIKLSEFFQFHSDKKFWMILGNHDMFGENPSAGHSLEVMMRLYKEGNCTFITDTLNVKFRETSVRFLSYPHTSFNLNSLNIFHKEVYGSKNDTGRIYEDKTLPSSKAVVCAGHLHTAHQVRNTYYSGTLYQTNFGESLSKYFHHIEFNSPKDHEVRLIPHDPDYKLHTIVLASRADLKTIPKGKKDLIKLVIQEGSNVSSSDYSNIENIVVIKAFKTQEELISVLTEDLVEGQQIVVKTEDFFQEWIHSLDVEEDMRSRIQEVRKGVLNSIQKRSA